MPRSPRRPRRTWPWIVLGVVVLFTTITTITITLAHHPTPPTENLTPTPTPEQPATQPFMPSQLFVPTPAFVPPPAEPTAAPPPPPPPVARVAPHPSDDSDDAVYYKNCDAAEAAGATPINRGQPGYRPALDRDNDNIACE